MIRPGAWRVPEPIRVRMDRVCPLASTSSAVCDRVTVWGAVCGAWLTQTVQDVDLPPGYFLGFSASTGDLSDNHDIYSVRVTGEAGASEADVSQTVRDMRTSPVPAATLPPEEPVLDTPAGTSEG